MPWSLICGVRGLVGQHICKRFIAFESIHLLC
jgi:hypothetical protein